MKHHDSEFDLFQSQNTGSGSFSNASAQWTIPLAGGGSNYTNPQWFEHQHPMNRLPAEGMDEFTSYPHSNPQSARDCFDNIRFVPPFAQPSHSAPKNKSLAILFLDLVQSGRLMDEQEKDTIAFLKRSLNIFDLCCDKHQGTLVKSTGDGALVVFDRTDFAVEYAVDVQSRISLTTGALGSRARFRAGVHYGDVELLQSEVLGSAVNVAAHLQKFADPGGVCVSGRVFNSTRCNARYQFKSLGKHRLKNIAGTTSIYRVVDLGFNPHADVRQ